MQLGSYLFGKFGINAEKNAFENDSPNTDIEKKEMPNLY